MGKYIHYIVIAILVLLIMLYFKKDNIELNEDYVRIECLDENKKKINNLEIGDVIICNILYQNNNIIDTISYLLDYGSGLDRISDENIDNYYSVDMSNVNDNLKIGFKVNENVNTTNLYIAIRNIRVMVKNKDYLIKNDYVYNLSDYYKKI